MPVTVPILLESARVSGAYASIRFALAHKIRGHAERRILLLTQRVKGGFIHTHDFTSVDDSYP